MKSKRNRLNLLDWLILTGLAATLALLGFLFRQHERVAPVEIPIVCVFRLPAAETPPSILVGDPVRNENGTVLFGEVTSVSSQPHRAFYLRNDSPVYGTMEGMSVTEVTVRMLAVRGMDYRVGDIRVCAGEIGNYRVGSQFIAGATTVSVEEGEKG